MMTFSPEYQSSVVANTGVLSCAVVSSCAPGSCSAREVRSVTTTDCQPARVTFDLPCSQSDTPPRDLAKISCETADSNAELETVCKSLRLDQGDTCPTIQDETARSVNSEVAIEDSQGAMTSPTGNISLDVRRIVREAMAAAASSQVRRRNNVDARSPSSSSVLGLGSSRESSSDRYGQQEADDLRGVSTPRPASRNGDVGKMKEEQSPRRPLRDKPPPRRYQPERAARK